MVEPFVLSEPVAIRAELPEGQLQARLHVLAYADDIVVATTCLDVCLES